MKLRNWETKRTKVNEVILLKFILEIKAYFKYRVERENWCLGEFK